MRTIILGAGNRGFSLAKHLVDDGKNVVVIDSKPEKIEYVSSRLDCLTICGSGIDVELLKSLGLDSSDTFVAVTDSDEVNVVSCGIVNSIFGAKRTVAAIRNIGYRGNSDMEGKSMLGITYVINPEEEAAKRISNMIMHGVYSDAISFQNSPLILHNVTIENGSAFIGKSLIEIRKQMEINFVIAAVYHYGKALIPAGDTIVREGDILSVVVESANVNKLMDLFDQKVKKTKKIVLAGGTPIAQYLLKYFDESLRKNVVLIEKDPEICNTFARNFPEILVLKEDLTLGNVFLDENLFGYDLMISLEESDEFNVLIAFIAKRFGFKHTLALIKSKSSYQILAQQLDIDAIISVTEETVNTLLKFLRDDNISSIQSLFGGQVEMLEYVITSESKIAGKRLMDLKMKNRGIIAGISKSDGSEVVPSGGYTIEPGDTLVLAVASGSVRFITSMMR